MARKKYPTSWENWRGKLAIIIFGGDKRPVVVFIKGINKHGDLIAQAVNTGETYFPSPLRCFEYSHSLYEKLSAQSKYRMHSGEAKKQLNYLKGNV